MLGTETISYYICRKPGAEMPIGMPIDMPSLCVLRLTADLTIGDYMDGVREDPRVLLANPGVL